MKIVFSGLESSGKSYKLAVTAVNIAERNSKWFKRQIKYYKKHGPIGYLNKFKQEKPLPRPIVSNLKFSDKFYEYVTKQLHIPIIYWKDLDALIQYQHADVFIDEISNYLDARQWKELSLEVKQWLSQGAKQGIEIYATAQDFAQVDLAFRRLVGGIGGLYYIRKLIGSPRPSATKPPVQAIWGLCAMTELDPIGYDEGKSKFVPISVIPKFFTLERKYCEIFDTNTKIEKGILPALRHMDRHCNECGKTMVLHS